MLSSVHTYSQGLTANSFLYKKVKKFIRLQILMIFEVLRKLEDISPGLLFLSWFYNTSVNSEPSLFCHGVLEFFFYQLTWSKTRQKTGTYPVASAPSVTNSALCGDLDYFWDTLYTDQSPKIYSSNIKCLKIKLRKNAICPPSKNWFSVTKSGPTIGEMLSASLQVLKAKWIDAVGHGR